MDQQLRQNGSEEKHKVLKDAALPIAVRESEDSSRDISKRRVFVKKWMEEFGRIDKRTNHVRPG